MVNVVWLSSGQSERPLSLQRQHPPPATLPKAATSVGNERQAQDVGHLCLVADAVPVE